MRCGYCNAKLPDGFGACPNCDSDVVVAAAGRDRPSGSKWTPLKVGVVGLLLASWPVLLLIFAGWGFGAAAIVIGNRRLARAAPHETITISGIVVGALALLIGVGSMLRLVSGAD